MATNTETSTAAQGGSDYIAFETSIKYDGSDVGIHFHETELNIPKL